ncbi:helix-turn-helix domain-containing protein [Romboutsia sp. 1001713B170207_170306_H8]|uniref:helix-turn-helix domain-containing protein n=1 Tax=Romboutsia sp. 1001713B170207_170306_H8 TaxID=2787112 RepID=UPI00189A5995|nr:helix-turn-helix transcriptional regulator [Romboutsia sp. 1001713B170207_170306_H8]
MATFGDRLRTLRKEKQLTTVQLGEIFNTTNSTISRYENGLREPRRDFLERCSEYFNVSIDYLLGASDERSPVDSLPNEFTSAEDAIAFLLKQPTLVAFGGYDLNKLSNEELLDFANDLLQQFKMVSYKYRK